MWVRRFWVCVGAELSSGVYTRLRIYGIYGMRRIYTIYSYILVYTKPSGSTPPPGYPLGGTGRRVGVGGGVPPSPPRGYVQLNCIPVVLKYKEVRWPPYTYRSFGRSRRALPGTTKRPVESCKDTSVRAVGKFFHLRKIFYGWNGFSIKFYKGYPRGG